jgi:hypothetical protein
MKATIIDAPVPAGGGAQPIPKAVQDMDRRHQPIRQFNN